jgi:hypothetical protein
LATGTRRTVERFGQAALHLLGEQVELLGAGAGVGKLVVSQQFGDFVGPLHDARHEAAHQAVAAVDAGQFNGQHQGHRTQVHLFAGVHGQLRHEKRAVPRYQAP